MKYLIGFFVLCSVSFAHLPDGPEFFSESGIYGNTYKEIVAELGSLRQKYPNYTEIIPLSKTVQGRTQYGILIFDRAQSTINRMTIITGATHGNEYLHIADRLPRVFLEQGTQSIKDYVVRGGAILIVPIINPDGYETRRRRNRNGVDLNRDFPNRLIPLKGLSQPETKNYVLWVNKFLNKAGAKLDMVLDYHCCDGSLLYPLGYTDKRIARKDLNRHIYVAKLMQKQFPKYRHGITGEVLGYYPKGTTKDYWYLDYGALAYTFEGEYRREDKKLAQHLAWWDSVFSFFNQPLLPSEM